MRPNSLKSKVTLWGQETPEEKQFTCVLIGEGMLPRECAQLLLKYKHNIKAIISPTSEVKAWCQKNDVRYYASPHRQEAQDFLKNERFDYLFSVNNNWILKAWLLERPEKLAINYHNALLPDYGGVHATSWAIYNQEKTHGITLHVMTEAVDGGNILLQEPLTILPNDTALSLNMRCQERFLSYLFPQLVLQLANGDEKRTHQTPNDKTKNTFHYLKDKINPIISWNQSAKHIERMCRSLDIGSYQNRLAIPQFIWNGQLFFPKKISISLQPFDQETVQPGQVMDITDDALLIATQDGLISIREITNVDGKQFSPKNFAKQHQLKRDVCLPVLPEDDIKALLEKRSQRYRDEFFWERQLRNIQPLISLPFQDLPAYGDQTVGKQRKTTDIIVYKDLPKEQLTIAFLLYLSRISSFSKFTVGFLNASTSPFLASVLPLTLAIDLEKSYESVAQHCVTAIKNIEQRSVYFSDFPHRIPGFDLNRLNLPLVIDLYSADLSVSEQCPFLLRIADGKIQLDYQVNLAHKTLLATLKDLTSSFNNFLSTILSNPNISFQDIPLLSDEEREEIVVKENIQKQTNFPKLDGSLVHQIFEQQAMRTPEAAALRFNQESISYAELNHRANQLAHYLLQYKPESPEKEYLIAICSERSIEMIVAIVAILKAGGAYVPIDPDYPEERVQYILEDTQPAVVLTQKSVTQKQPKLFTDDRTVVFLDQDNFEYSQYAITNPTNAISDASHLAYIIYTSGTTGVPKGVMLEHHSLVNRLTWMRHQYPLQTGERFLHKTPFVFDWSFSEMLLPLISGACLVIAQPGGHKDPHYLGKIIKEENIDYIHFVPSMLLAFIEYASTFNLGEFSSIKHVFLSGEAVTADMVEKTKSIFSCEVDNLYGPTEGGEVSFHHCANVSNPTVPSGKAIANGELYVLDEHQQPLPRGVVGQLYIGGTVLARGYWNKPQKTQEKFIQNSFANGNNHLSKRLYATGDLARWLPDSSVDFLGRADHQVKVRGMRVELSGIEAVLRAHDNISNCVVVKWKNTLVAYISLNAAQTISRVKLRAFLQSRLPTHMVPDTWIFLNKIPTNTNGKVDRKALPEPTRAQFLENDAYRPPVTLLQVSLVEIWENLLGIPSLGIQDSFIEMGGSSIEITRLFAEVKKQYNIKIQLREFLDNPTILYLSQVINNIRPEKIQTSFEKDLSQGLDESIRLSFSGSVRKKPKSFLLTGATGFLGASILYQLIFQTGANVYCLVRSESEQAALDKLYKNFKKYYPFSPIKGNNRIKIILGDLELPYFGLSEEQFRNLSEKIDIIYHNGAYVHHLYNYHTLRACNVLSTIELIKLACCGNPKKLCYISTLSAAKQNEGGYATETFIDLDDQPPEHVSGYAKTKWMSERLLSQAHKRGVPVVIFRPSWITGKRESGAFAVEHDHLSRLIKSCIQLQNAPNWDIALSMIPVDFISDLIVKMSLSTEEIGNVFNLSNKHLIHWNKLISWIRDYGYPVGTIEADVWCHLLSETDASNALYPLLPLYAADVPHVRSINQGLWFSENSNVEEFLRNNELHYPEIDDSLLKKYFEFFHKCEFLEKPTRHMKNLRKRRSSIFQPRDFLKSHAEHIASLENRRNSIFPCLTTKYPEKHNDSFEGKNSNPQRKVLI